MQRLQAAQAGREPEIENINPAYTALDEGDQQVGVAQACSDSEGGHGHGHALMMMILRTPSWRAFYQEALRQYRIAVPMMITSLLQSLYPIISLMFVGHLAPTSSLELPSPTPSPSSLASLSCLEYWSFEIMVLLSGLLKNPELETSVLGICVNTETLQYMLPFGLSMATSTRVANELGAGDSKAAKFAVNVALRISLIQSGALSLIFSFLRNVWGRVFSSNTTIISAITQMMPLLTLTIFFDGIQGVLSGVARGCAWQHFGAYINFAAFYGIGILAALVLALIFKLNSMGLWGGLALGLVLQTIALFIVTSKIRWNNMVEEARQRTMLA